MPPALWRPDGTDPDSLKLSVDGTPLLNIPILVDSTAEQIRHMIAIMRDDTPESLKTVSSDIMREVLVGGRANAEELQKHTQETTPKQLHSVGLGRTTHSRHDVETQGEEEKVVYVRASGH